ncbi:MAG: nickel-dependent hydrogenase large subunit, partial [Pseudonocardiales bacterium]|nr:nickel-dependent hydrogenase large subunit [Pseudonocardiales bacterium]
MTTTAPRHGSAGAARGQLTEMVWDPVTRIVGSLGIYTKIDFAAGRVAECHSTSSVFRGYSIFMKGKDPRDAHFITSRICGICGDNHATCSVYNQNMAYGVAPPHLGEWCINLGEAAEYMFDHSIFQDNLVFVDFCEQMVEKTNPSLMPIAQRTRARNAHIHGYQTVGDILRSFNPFSGETYRAALEMSRLTREMFCLMEGRHVHPSTLYPGGVGTVASPQVFSDYLSRLLRFVDFAKKLVPMNDDAFDFFLEALPGYERVGKRRTLLGCWGSFQNPDTVDYRYEHMTSWGRDMFVTPGIVVDGELITTDLVEINLGMRILLGSSFYEDWVDGATMVPRDPLGNPIDPRHPWNQVTIPRPQKRDLDGGKYSWVMSPRWFWKKTGEHLALDTGGGPLARLWATALAGRVNTPYVQATGKSVRI